MSDCFDIMECAVFVKTPGQSPLKTRLAAEIGLSRALEFYNLSIHAVQEVLQSTSFVYPYWSVAEGERCFDKWRGMKAIDQGQGDLGHRLDYVYRKLNSSSYRVLLGADAPQISQALLQEANIKAKDFDFVIGPAADGGFYLFLGKTDIPTDVWCSVTYSEDSTTRTLISRLEKYGTVGLLPSLTDVDYMKDLHSLHSELGSLGSLMTKKQEILFQWLQKFIDTDS